MLISSSHCFRQERGDDARKRFINNAARSWSLSTFTWWEKTSAVQPAHSSHWQISINELKCIQLTTWLWRKKTDVMQKYSYIKTWSLQIFLSISGAQCSSLLDRRQTSCLMCYRTQQANWIYEYKKGGKRSIFPVLSQFLLFKQTTTTNHHSVVFKGLFNLTTGTLYQGSNNNNTNKISACDLNNKHYQKGGVNLSHKN